MKKKIIIVYQDLENNIAEEKIWATEKDGYFIIDNIPFFAPNLALFDKIKVEKEEGNYYFEELIEESGHSTIQIIFFQESEIKRVLDVLESNNCAWEGLKNKPYYSIDIAIGADYNFIIQILNNEMNNNVLDYKEACISSNHKLN